LLTTLWTAMTVLIGLRHQRERVRAMIEGVRDMVFRIRHIEGFWVYSDILAESLTGDEAKGAVLEARHALLLVGRQKLGEPDERVLSQLADLRDLQRLNLLLEVLLDAAGWDDLLARLSTGTA